MIGLITYKTNFTQKLKIDVPKSRKRSNSFKNIFDRNQLNKENTSVKT